MTRAEKVNVLADAGRRCGVKPGQRLTASKKLMDAELRRFFHAVIACNVKHPKSFTLQEIADALDRLGVASAHNRELRDSHISNAIRKSIKQVGPLHKKPTYKGKNHYSFGSTPAPDKVNFASLNR